LKLRLLNGRRCCRSGLNGQLHHVLAIIFAGICAARLNSREPSLKADLLRTTLLALFLSLFVTSSSAVAADQANVFIYHRFNDNRYPSTNISTTEFREHLQILADEDYRVLSLGQVVEALREQVPLPERCAVISIDDAYKSFKTEAWPLLKEFGYPVTLFVNTDQVGGGDFLDWDELEQLQREGVEIGNHSASHLYMLDRLASETPQAWRQRIVHDIEKAQSSFAEHLGKKPELFAYPYGEFSNELVKIVAGAGFRAAFGQQSGVITPGQDMFKLPRFPMGGSGPSGHEDFRQKLKMHHLPLRMSETQDTVIAEEKPPELKFFLNDGRVSLETLRCYASAGLKCSIEELPAGKGFVAKSSGQLTGRRGKYTITAADASGKNWYWYSQLWVLVGSPVSDNPVP